MNPSNPYYHQQQQQQQLNAAPQQGNLVIRNSRELDQNFHNNESMQPAPAPPPPPRRSRQRPRRTDEPPTPTKRTRRCYRRHSAPQLKELEAVFKECPHPDEKQRVEMSTMLGLDSTQIKFWFQNKRTQIKIRHERAENNVLRVENENLRIENEKIKQILLNATCINCGGEHREMTPEEEQTWRENEHIRKEIMRVQAVVASFGIHIEVYPYDPSLYNGMPSHDMSSQHNSMASHDIPSQFNSMPFDHSMSSQHNNMPYSHPHMSSELNNMPSHNIPSQHNSMPSDSYIPSPCDSMPSHPNMSYQYNDMPSDDMSSLNNNMASQHHNILSHDMSFQHNDVPSHGISSLNNMSSHDMPPQHNIMHNDMPSHTMASQGMPSQHSNMASHDMPFQYNNMPSHGMSSQHSNLPSSSLNQGIGSYGAKSPVTIVETSVDNGSDPLVWSLPVPNSDKAMMLELAVASLEEFMKLVIVGQPLWIIGNHKADILNGQEYSRAFPHGIGPKLEGFKSESSRESMMINMNHINLIEILMDVDQWSRVFCSIVSRAAIHEVVSTGHAGCYDGTLHVMSAEFQVPSPFVPPREYYFLRYCKKLSDETWAVVDVSLETIRPSATRVSTGRRRPSGCLIQALPDGCSTKVTWIEHVEVDAREVAVHSSYQLLVDSGLAFGATRWVATLDRQCQRITSTLTTNLPQGRPSGITREGRKGLLKLAERIVMGFCTGVGACTPHPWAVLTPVESPNSIRLITRKGQDVPGWPSGVILGAATSFWLEVPPKRVFYCLRNDNLRSQWDILAEGGVAEEFARIAVGHDPDNCVSLLRVKTSSPNPSHLILVQETCTDSAGSYVMYAPMDVDSADKVLSGENPDRLPVLSSGFAVLPDGPLANGWPGRGGCLVTISLQILVESDPTKKISIYSVSTVNHLIKTTIERVKTLVTMPDQSAGPSKYI